MENILADALLSPYWVPGPKVLVILVCFYNPYCNPLDSFYPHFIEEETEAERG